MRPIVHLSKAAINHCREIIKNNNEKKLRLSLKSGGCNGFKYKFDMTDDRLEKGDERIKIEDIELIICGKSILSLLETKIDWKKDIMGGTFHFDNPNAKAICGCGTSFNLTS